MTLFQELVLQVWSRLATIFVLLTFSLCADAHEAMSCSTSEDSSPVVLSLWKKACSGDQSAMLALGDLYKTGTAVPPDLARAREFYTLAAVAGGKPNFVYVPPAGNVPGRVERIEALDETNLAARERLQALSVITEGSRADAATSDAETRFSTGLLATLQDAAPPPVSTISERLNIKLWSLKTKPEGMISYQGDSKDGMVQLGTYSVIDPSDEVIAAIWIEIKPRTDGSCLIDLMHIERSILKSGWRATGDINYMGVEAKTYATSEDKRTLQMHYSRSIRQNALCVKRVRYTYWNKNLIK